ncbi:hypothetical protein Tco_1011125 [Tanacetum coccineum]
MKVVPPPLSENYIPLSDPTDLDESQMTYGPKQTHTSDSEPKTSDLDSCVSNSSVESLDFFTKSVCARNESVRKADNPRKNNKSPREKKNLEMLSLMKCCKGALTRVPAVDSALDITPCDSDVINSPCYHNKELASPEQTATGKDISNPFMAVMTCQKSYSSSTSYDSCSESGKWFQSSMDHPLSGPRLDADFHNAVNG